MSVREDLSAQPDEYLVPQGYPLECVTGDGRRWLVIGWSPGGEIQGGVLVTRPCPRVVPFDRYGTSRLLTGQVKYALAPGGE